MATPLYGNPFLLARATALQAYLNGVGATVRLFSNNFLPTPATPVGSFAECNFTGYAGVPIVGQFGAPNFVIDGQYQILSTLFSFNCVGGAPQNIWGWYITQGGNLLAAQVFSAAVVISSGQTYSFSLRPQEISQSIL